VRHALEEFYKRYHESYGIELRDPAEVTTARVRAVLPAGSQGPPPSAPPPGSGTTGTRRVWLDGAVHEIPAIARDACAPGDKPSGPCVITEPQCSLLIPPGWHGTVDDHGAIVLERSTP
jgi:N-methylhydantoinase A